jgi:hypothetical protein
MRAIDFWLDNIVVGYIAEFAVDTFKSYSVSKKSFLRAQGEGTLGRCTLRSRDYCTIKGYELWNQTSKLPCMHGGVRGNLRKI